MMRRPAALLLLLSAACVATAGAAQVDYPKAVAGALKANRLPEVNRLCSEWAKASPGDERPRLILGRALLHSGAADRAIEQFELAAEANPLSPLPHCELGNLFLDAAKPDAATREFDAALRLDRACLPATLGKTRVTLLQGDAHDALAAATRAMTSHPKDPAARALAAECLHALGKPAEALARAREAVALDGANAAALFVLARACQATGRDAEAQTHWRRFLDVEPAGRRAHAVRHGWVVLSTRVVWTGSAKAAPGVAWSPDGRLLAFTPSQGRFASLSLAQASAPPKPIAQAPSLYTHPTWSPDGRHIAMLERSPQGVYTVVVVPSDGGGQPRRLGRALGVTWSSRKEGLLLAEVVEAGWGLRAMTLEGEVGKALLLPPRWTAPDGSQWRSLQPDLGPDGHRLVLCAGARGRGYQILAAGLDQPKARTPLAPDLPATQAPDFSPDGRSVAFLSTARETGGVWVAAADGSGQPARLVALHDPALALAQPEWSPDGRALAYRTSTQMRITRLGGLTASPIAIAAEPDAAGLAAQLTNTGATAVAATLRYELFDSRSHRLAAGPMGKAEMTLKPGDVIECVLDLPAKAKAARVAKLTAVTADGKRAIRLVDMAQP